MNEELNIAEKNAEVILIKFEVLVEIVELLEGDLESLGVLKKNAIENLNKFIILELKDYFKEASFAESDLISFIKELNSYESADSQLRYINQKVDDGFWKRIETMLDDEFLNKMRLELQEAQA